MGWAVQAKGPAESNAALWSWMQHSRADALSLQNTLLGKSQGSLEQTRWSSVDCLLGKKMWEMGLRWKTEKSLGVSPWPGMVDM